MVSKVFDCIGNLGLALAIAGVWMLGTELSSLIKSMEYRISCQLPCIFTSIKEDCDEYTLSSITAEINPQGSVVRFNAEELITLRELVSREVEAKQVAQQEVERARFVVETVKQQKKVAIISPEGDSKDAKLMTNWLASAGGGLIELHKLEVTEAMA
ncbi:hypothetical protein HJG60_012252 [Phyllostomus discolor]|uniref:Prohibitin n=1 Tax=Phyllostomus discolor TaxID=89673 RepID=A0A833ZG42_9CHIR|nr:hypothetical protein HJG60_012252 [Phyllostomus discolor]